jgi:CubicO group peptidase (beta-lactamase class C family)
LSKQLPDPETTIFEIGSLTKTFTSLLLANEVVNGRMRLDAPINRYLPDSIPPLAYHGKPITLQNLANHTSGLPRLPANIFKGKVDPLDPYQHYNTSLLYSFLVNYKTTVEPGKLFSYSNYGAGLLGEILARQAHTTFEYLIVNRICLPLGMKNTAITLNESENRHFAQGYNEKGEATSPWHLASLQGSGAISSTLNDMIKYTQVQMGGASTLEKAIRLTHKITFENKENTIGLGWRIVRFGNNTYWHHSGGTGGFRSFVGFDKQRQMGVVILSNTAEEVTDIGEAILRN